MAVAGGLTWYVTRTPASVFQGSVYNRTSDTALVQRGEYIARLGDCVACHSTSKGAPFSGGLPMATPMGTIYTTNITPDKQTGIGNYSLADFDRAVRAGVAADGHRLYPAMPYPSYVKFSDDDVRALYAFFMQGVAPVVQENRQNKIPWPLDLRWPLALWNAAFLTTNAYQTKISQDPMWNRGAYIVQGAGHCGSCHTPRAISMNEKALDESNPNYLSGALLDSWYAPSLRQDPNTGLGHWSETEIYTYLKTGRNKHSVVLGTMAEVFNNSTQYMSDYDLQSIARYLVSLPGDPERDGVPRVPVHTTNSNAVGASTYAAKCSSCHGLDGAGQGQWIPPLAGASSAMAATPATVINVTLNGSIRVLAAGVPDAYRMPVYRDQLSDTEIADVLTYIRSAWGNQGGSVEVDDVKNMRGHTDPASSNPIFLQMR